MPDTVTLPRSDFTELVVAAHRWHTLLESPHCADLLGEWLEWRQRRDLRQVSHAFSAGLDWQVASRTPAYAELRRRRTLTSTLPCGGCGEQATLTHPLPDHHAALLPDVSWVRCGRCYMSRSAVAA
jgi:hypothetical protein